MKNEKDAVLVRKVFLAMLVPTILMNTVTCITALADTIIVGNFLGESALASITFSTPAYMLINTLAALIAVGGTTLMSIAIGSGNKEESDEIFSLMMLLGVITGVVFAFMGAMFIDPIVKILGARGELAELTREYALIVFYFTPVIVMNIALAFIVRCDGRPNLAMAGMLAAIIANIVLDLIFIIPFQMGVAGAAWATGASQAISAAIIATHFYSKKNTLKFVKPSLSKSISIFKGGAGTSLHFVYQFIAILFFNNFIMQLAGGVGIVVYTVVMNVSTVAMSIFEGLSQTVQPMFSVYHGEGNNKAIKATYRLSLTATLVLGGAVTAILLLFPHALVKAFGVTDVSAMSMSVAAIRIFSVSIILMTFNVIMGYYYQSTERVVLAAVIVALRNLAALLLGVIVLGGLFGINGIWGAYIFAEIATFAAWFAYVKRKERAEGACDGILLLPSQPDVYSRYLSADLEELHAVIGEIKLFFDERGADETLAARVMLAVDELVANVIMHGGKKGLNHIEVRIVLKDEILLVIRDDGILFDHSAFAGTKPIREGGHGLKLIHKTASSFEYRPALGLNRTLVKYRNC